MANFDAAIKTVLDHEGGFVNHEKDPGGATKYGISLRYLIAKGDLKYDLDHDGVIDLDDVRTLKEQDAKEIYYKDWWSKYDYSRFSNQRIATKTFDAAVNMGQSQATKLLQRAINRLNPETKLIVDGLMGNKTIAAANQCDEFKLLSAIRTECADFYSELVKKNSHFFCFEAGWLRRAYS